MEAHMNPCFMGDRLVEGMRGSVGTLLFRYSSDLQCIPVGFKRLEPCGTHAAVVAESPYIHFLINFTTIGFVPQVGKSLLGRIQETQTAIGMNVQILNAFNFFVRKADLP